MTAADCITPWNLAINLLHEHRCQFIYDSPVTNDPFALLDYLPYFLKTFLLELPIYLLLLRGLKSLRQILLINLVVNLATHPIVFFGIPLLLINGTYLQYLIIAEIFAPAVEAWLLFQIFKIRPGRAILAALLANLFSWGVGVYW